MILYKQMVDDNQTEIVEGVAFLLNSLNNQDLNGKLPNELLSSMEADSRILLNFERTLRFIFGASYEKFDGTFFVFNKSYYDTNLYSYVSWHIDPSNAIYKNSKGNWIAEMALCFDDDTNECFLINFYTMIQIIHPEIAFVDGWKEPYFEANYPMGYHKYSDSLQSCPFNSYNHGTSI